MRYRDPVRSAPRRYFPRVRGAAGTCLCALLALGASGCGSESGNATATEGLIESAEGAIDRGEVLAATNQLKAIIAREPNNARARWLLGTVHLDAGDGAYAAKELQRAADLGVAVDSVQPLLIRALLMEGKYDDVIAFPVKDPLTPQSKGTVFATQALAWLGKGDEQRARTSLELAEGQDPDASYVQTAKAALAMAQGDLVETRRVLEAVLARDPAHALAWSRLGDLELRENHRDEALEAFTQAIAHRHDDASDQIKRALIRIELGDFEQAQKDIEGVKRTRGEVTGVHHAEGLIALKQQRYEEAIIHFEQALRTNEKYQPAALLLAGAYFALNHLEQAESYAKRVVAQNPDYARGRKLLALIMAREGRYDEVEALLKPVVAVDANDAFSLNLLGLAFINQGKAEEGTRALGRVAELQPDSSAAQQRLGYALLAGGEQEGGLSRLRSSVELDPGNAGADIVLIDAYLRADLKDQALDAALAYRNKKPGEPLPHVVAASVYLARGEQPEAHAALLKAKEIAPGHPGANGLLAVLATGDGNLEEAKSCFQAILAESPNHLGALIGLARTVALKGESEAVTELLERAVAAHPTALQPRLMLVRDAIARGQFASALHTLRDLEKNYPDNPDLLFLLALSSLETGETDLAERAVQALVQQKPRDADALFLLARVSAARGDADGVAKGLETALEINPDHFPARLAYTRMLMLNGQLDAAEKSLGTLGGSAADQADVQFLEGLIEGARNRPQEARASLQSAFEARPTTSSMLGLARTIWVQGQVSQAIELQTKWVSEHPDDLSARLALAEGLQAAGKERQAMEQYRAVLERDERNVRALNNLAWLLRTEDTASAASFARTAAELAPDSPLVQDTLAAVLVAGNALELAERTVDKALSKNPENPTLNYRKAFILEKQGKRDAARGQLEGLLAERRAFPERAAAEGLLRSIRGN